MSVYKPTLNPAGTLFTSDKDFSNSYNKYIAYRTRQKESPTAIDQDDIRKLIEWGLIKEENEQVGNMITSSGVDLSKIAGASFIEPTDWQEIHTNKKRGRRTQELQVKDSANNDTKAAANIISNPRALSSAKPIKTPKEVIAPKKQAEAPKDLGTKIQPQKQLENPNKKPAPSSLMVESPPPTPQLKKADAATPLKKNLPAKENMPAPTRIAPSEKPSRPELPLNTTIKEGAPPSPPLFGPGFLPQPPTFDPNKLEDESGVLKSFPPSFSSPPQTQILKKGN